MQLTRFFGREEEITWIARTLSYLDVRLVTLTGLGGTGKTRLALEVARVIQAGGAEGGAPTPAVGVGRVPREGTVMGPDPGREQVGSLATAIGLGIED